jgi:uncharacterized delta-60 repeat protein
MFSAGQLDPTFGNGGRTPTPFGFDVQDSVPLPDGKVVVVGGLKGGFAVGRLNADGTRDRSFGGGDGLVTTEFGAKALNMAQQVALQRDGKIVAAGFLKNDALSKESQWALARYNVDGSPDKTFSGDGKTTLLGFDLTSGITDLAIQSDGKIVFCGDHGTRGGTFSDDNFDFALMRLQTNGSLDRKFGTIDGAARKGFVFTGMGEQDRATSLAIQPNGRIVVGGNSRKVGGDGKFALARYTSDGRLDNTFDKDGKLVKAVFGEASIRALALQGDGKIVAVGTADRRFAVQVFNGDGSIEPESKFGVLGKLAAGSSESADSVIIPQPGKILVVGHAEFNINTGLKPQFVALQFLASGKLDQSFGINGMAKFEAVTRNAIGPDASLTQDGKVVVAASRTVLRFVQSVPRVNVISAAQAFEQPGGDGIFQITRDAAYNYPTRVFYKVSGTATPGADYTGPLAPQSSRSQGGAVQLPGGRPVNVAGPVLTQTVRSIVIPAGQTSVLIPVNVVNDSRIEAPESVIVTAQANAAYTLGQASATVTIIDDD